MHFASFVNNFIVMTAPLNVSLFHNVFDRPIGFVQITLIEISLLQTKKRHTVYSTKTNS